MTLCALPKRDPRPIPVLGRSCRPLIRLGALVAGTSLAGCDIPTEAPVVDTRWVVASGATQLRVTQLLPGAVSLTQDSSAFVVDFDPVSFAESLGGLCPPCALADGQTVPKPAFLSALGSTIDFPSGVYSVEVVSGEIVLEIVNGLNFDPLRPAPGVSGTITVTVTDDADGDVLGTLTLDGSVTALAPGTTSMHTLTLLPGTVDGSLVATVAVDSPLGDPVTLDSSRPVIVTATPTNILVASADVDVANRDVALEPVALDVRDVDPELTDRILEGAFHLDATNPFGVSADTRLSITGPTITTIEKSATIGSAPNSTLTLGLSAAELKSFLGHANVTLSGGAVFDPAAAVATVRPREHLVLGGKLDLTLRLGQ